MRVGQRETGCRVVKFAIRPLNSVVARVACRGEAGARVGDGRGRIVVIGQVAVHAGPAGDVVIAELRVMTVGALPGRIGVGVRQ